MRLPAAGQKLGHESGAAFPALQVENSNTEKHWHIPAAPRPGHHAARHSRCRVNGRAAAHPSWWGDTGVIPAYPDGLLEQPPRRNATGPSSGRLGPRADPQAPRAKWRLRSNWSTGNGHCSITGLRCSSVRVVVRPDDLRLRRRHAGRPPGPSRKCECPGCPGYIRCVRPCKIPA